MNGTYIVWTYYFWRFYPIYCRVRKTGSYLSLQRREDMLLRTTGSDRTRVAAARTGLNGTHSTRWTTRTPPVELIYAIYRPFAYTVLLWESTFWRIILACPISVTYCSSTWLKWRLYTSPMGAWSLLVEARWLTGGPVYHSPRYITLLYIALCCHRSGPSPHWNNLQGPQWRRDYWPYLTSKVTVPVKSYRHTHTYTHRGSPVPYIRGLCSQGKTC